METPNLVTGIPEQGGDALSIRLKGTSVDITVGGSPSEVLELHIYRDGELIATMNIQEMEKKEAPDAVRPYLVHVWDAADSTEWVERVVDGYYS